MAELREFQMAAVDRIVTRLTSTTGSRRFLLADEVGLGKTLVAKGVIDKLRNLKSKDGFTIIYICSNSEIADQNRGKLCDDQDSAVPGRLTLLSLQSQQIVQRRENRQLQVFAFTPGTSLQIENGTGIAKERRLLLYLLLRVWRKRINQPKWREFFRCTAGEERWQQETRFGRLKKEFFRSIAGDLQARLKDQWESQQVQLLDPETGVKNPQSNRLPDCIDMCVEEFTKPQHNSMFNRKNRNYIIAELRKGLARVSLEFLEPQLTILDEFQRFSDILVVGQNEKSIVGKLFSKGSGAILILSATPYKMYTLPHENEDHHRDFLKTLAFLRNEHVDGPGLASLQQDLRGFRERLALGEWATADDPILFNLRERIENQLKEVMCRTERNWYLEDAAKGVTEITEKGVLPQKSELAEYVHLRQFLLSHKVGDWNITDFWKSSSSVLSFMDRQYGLINRLHRNHLSIPPTVLRPSTELPKIARDNTKFHLLFEKVFDKAKVKDVVGSWKYLWVRPTYTYYKDTFYENINPKKYLVFSHWRFVPKAVSVLTSQEALKRIGRDRRRLLSAPLQFRERIAFYPFDVCYPSLVLANYIDQFPLQFNGTDLPSEKVIFMAARRKIKALLAESGVQMGKVHTAPLWKIIARLEDRSPFKVQIQMGLRHAQGFKPEESTEYFYNHCKQYLTWMDDDSPLSISPIWLERLTHIALYSPAVTLLRSILSIFPQESQYLSEAWCSVLKFCLGPLRHYFNKRLVQTIIRRQGPRISYTGKILSYCKQAHFQAVLDEYAYLVRHVLQQDNIKDFLEHIGRAMGMWSGSPGINGRTPSGHISRRPKPQPTNFALAFGDDVSNESKKADGKARKSAVREAFNSPFWPFVLATTSVGQEGLDFHLYCRDIIHWNLPSNPVDLEQREGRINRYDGLSIRQNIGIDFPLAILRTQPGENLWKSIFHTLIEKSHENGMFKNGMFPHWVYQSQNRNEAGIQDQSIIRRHLLFFKGSKDLQHYLELKISLALYRLVFGQPRQQDILEQISSKCHIQPSLDLNTSLAKYMINLSPFTSKHAVDRANVEAKRLLLDPEKLRDLLQRVSDHMMLIPPSVLKEIEKEVTDLVHVASGNGICADERQRHRALAAILYLLDPYDAVHDRHGVMGYLDDIKIVREAHAYACNNTR
jgi:hypothetical protein